MRDAKFVHESRINQLEEKVQSSTLICQQPSSGLKNRRLMRPSLLNQVEAATSKVEAVEPGDGRRVIFCPLLLPL
jgi:hypothetical protein